MNLALRPFGIFAFVAFAMLAFWATRPRSEGRSERNALKDAVYYALTNPVAFGISHLTGGVGIVISIDPATGILEIHDVLADSPAEKAGLRPGDRVILVDGVATAGRTLAENTDRITGFAASSVALTVQRTGSTDLKCVVHRSAWKSLGRSQ